jgi:hypothetical protein
MPARLHRPSLFRVLAPVFHRCPRTNRRFVVRQPSKRSWQPGVYRRFHLGTQFHPLLLPAELCLLTSSQERGQQNWSILHHMLHQWLRDRASGLQRARSIELWVSYPAANQFSAGTASVMLRICRGFSPWRFVPVSLAPPRRGAQRGGLPWWPRSRESIRRYLCVLERQPPRGRSGQQTATALPLRIRFS